MLINPFEVKYSPKKFKTKKNTVESVDIDEVINYITVNYSRYIKDENKKFFEDKIKEYICLKYFLPDNFNYTDIINKVIDKIFGYGILQKYIDNNEITDIRVVQYDVVYIKQMGKWKKVEESFCSREEFREYIIYTITKNNKTINYDNPIVVVSDKKNKLRLEAGISPVNALDDSLVIRIHRYTDNLTLLDLLNQYKMLDRMSYKVLIEILNKYKNIIIAGKGGSGKTTLLRAILKQIPDNVSVSVNEETSELYIKNKNLIQREVIIDKEKNNVTLEKLLKHSLVMSNDVLVVGELKGGETSIFIDAISTGHMGLATVHSNSIYNVIDRLTLLFKRDKKAEKYSEEFIQNLLYNSINYIIYMKDFKISSIGKVSVNNKNKYYVEEIYKLNV